NYSEVREERHTETYPNIYRPMNTGTHSSGGVSSAFSKKSTNSPKQATTHKNSSPFVKKVLSSNLFSNQGKHHITAQAKRK
ncbi:MAG TPA: hypothetical protein VGQ53_19620, partial [Chitinophagaceae bacterium]|nr:hypothetical protein [Chitinophagaceae bacterium]